jgi:hypothetical protein
MARMISSPEWYERFAIELAEALYPHVSRTGEFSSAADIVEFLERLGSDQLAAAVVAASIRCDDGASRVDCEFILRPNATPYYRCVGHSPSHCYDADGDVITCP